MMKYSLAFIFFVSLLPSAFACKQTPYAASLSDVTSLVKHLADKGELYFDAQASLHNIYEWSTGIYAVEGRIGTKECKVSLFQVERAPSCERAVAPANLKLKIALKCKSK